MTSSSYDPLSLHGADTLTRADYDANIIGLYIAVLSFL